MTAKLTNNFTEDMAMKILTRLPVKSVIRFSFASKGWRSRVISSSSFAKSHFEIATEQSTIGRRLLASSSLTSRLRSIDLGTTSFLQDSKARRLTSPLDQTGRSIRLLGSCNGLVLISLDTYESFYIWNPTTGFLHNLPDPGLSSKGEREIEITKHGLGYVSATKDYKVLIGYYVRKHYYEFLLFSFGANSWKRINDPRSSNSYLYDDTEGVLSHEALHWLDKMWVDGQVTLSFDLAKEEFHELPVPDFDEMDFWTHLGAFPGGYLCVALGATYQAEGEEYIVFSVMGKYGVGESWTQPFKHEIFVYKFGFCEELLHCVKPVLYTESRTVVVIFFDDELIQIEKRGENVMSFSLRYPTEHKLAVLLPYEETLLSLIDYQNVTPA